MATNKPTTKRIQISKTNATVVAIVAACSFLVTFSLVSSKMLLSKRAYQSKVIQAKEKARNQLTANIATASKLETSYREFTGSSSNVLGGDPNGKGDKDGDNGKIVLDALPSKYDFPALATSVEKMLAGGPYALKGITGTDDEVNQTANQQSTTQKAVEMPFTFSAEGNFAGISELITKSEHSIRPIIFDSLTLTATDGNITLQATARTYYQPSKSLNIKTEVLK